MSEGIRVDVEVSWLPDHSDLTRARFAFSYTVTITNEGDEPATLLARHWEIADSNGHTEHVRGPGVVGYQPVLKPRQSFSYTSGAIIKTPSGTMGGEYLFVRPDGRRFEAKIPSFGLVTPAQIQ